MSRTRNIKPVITIIDRVNGHLGGSIPPNILSAIKKKLSFKEKGAHMSPAFKLGHWDGKECLVDENNCFYLYHIETIIDELGKYVDLDDIEVAYDCIEPPVLPTEPIDENYMLDETGFTLRSTQLRTINDAIEAQNGIFDAATSAGKTLICCTLAKYYQRNLPSLTVVPSAQLLAQTYEYYADAGLDVVALDAKKIKKNDDRLDAIRSHKHVIITYKLLSNLITYANSKKDNIFRDNDRVIMYDECHEFGDTMFDAFKNDLSMCTIRFGMSGTVPKDKLKYEKICGSLGAGVITTVSVKELTDKGYVSKLNIKMVTTKHTEVEELCTPQAVRKGAWDWDKESRYFSNALRAREIADYISGLPTATTLVLCHPQLGHKMCQHLELPFIDKDTEVDERQRLFSEMERTGGAQYASFDTSGTGISVNGITRVVIIDAGKNETHIKQGIGRGLRLDGEDNFCEVIDISADTHFAKKHRNDRIKVYKRDEYNYTLDSGVIVVDS